MILYIILALLFGGFIGAFIERYRWVGRAKSGKFKEVDGDLYQVRKVKRRDPGGIR